MIRLNSSHRAAHPAVSSGVFPHAKWAVIDPLPDRRLRQRSARPEPAVTLHLRCRPCQSGSDASSAAPAETPSLDNHSAVIPAVCHCDFSLDNGSGSPGVSYANLAARIN